MKINNMFTIENEYVSQWIIVWTFSCCLLILLFMGSLNIESHLCPFSVPSSVSSYDKNQAYSTEWSDDEQPTAYSGNENGGNGNSFEDDSSTGRGVRVRALYDYEGQEQDELSFKAGNYQRTDATRCVILVCHHRSS